jgi:hypothetical protein
MVQGVAKLLEDVAEGVTICVEGIVEDEVAREIVRP